MSEATATNWPALTLLECRVLGVLIEKQKTTPDIYPLSVNALVTGSNQKSNRDPVLNVDDVEVEEALVGLQQKGLVSRIESGRVEKWRHHVYERWTVSKEEIAVLAELLLRGPQTEGELRARASRMEPLNDRDALRAVLGPLVERGLAVWLSPEGRRGALLTHGFHDPAEVERLRSQPAIGDAGSAPQASAGPNVATRLNQLESDLRDLRGQMAELRSKLESLHSAAPPP